jgi:hypothetical protein
MMVSDVLLPRESVTVDRSDTYPVLAGLCAQAESQRD